MTGNFLPCGITWTRDADVASFFYYLTQAVKKTAPRRRPLPLLTPEYLPGIGTFTRRYFESLYQRLPLPFALVFENYQEVSPHCQLHALIQEGIGLAPVGFQFFFVSRDDPPPHFAGLRAGNKVSYLGWDDLRFTMAEAMALIRSQKRQPASDAVMAELHRQTGGWAAGLVLAVEKVKSGSRSAPFPADLPKEQIFEYFAGQVFTRLEIEKQDFLLRTAFPPNLPLSLAERLTGTAQAGHILAELHRKNYFTDKLASSAPVYRYHPLFREFLLHRGRETFQSAEYHRIQCTTGELLAEIGETVDAVSLMQQAGHWEGVVRIVVTHARALLEQGRSATLENWLDAIPAELSSDIPWVLYWKGCCRLMASLADGRSLFEQAFAGFQRQQDPVGTLLAWSSIVDSLLYEVDDLTLLDRWIDWLDQWSLREPVYPVPEIEAKVAASMAWALTWRRPQRPSCLPHCHPAQPRDLDRHRPRPCLYPLR